MRLLSRSIGIFLFLFNFIVLSTVVNILFFWAPFFKRHLITFLTVNTSKLILWALNFKIQHKGPLPQKGSLIIGNHMSYLDILIYLSQFKTLFVTSTDMRSRFFLGQMTQLGGCLYVNRRNPKHLVKELKNIKRFFERGFSVTIFPEGTSSNGAGVLPFKKSLFQIALQTKCPIQPVALCYSTVDGEKFGPHNCDKVCWYGDLPFFPHLIGLLKMKSVTANMQVLATIDSSKFSDRKLLCDKTYDIVSKGYNSLLEQ